jgi:C1A family cysteine protease
VESFEVKDQGRRGTCVACATTAAHELVRGEDEQLCVEFVHWAAKQRDGLPNSVEGTTIAAARIALGQEGQPREETWPYDEMRNPRSAEYKPPQPAIAEAKLRKCSGGKEWKADVSTLLAALNTGTPIVLGIVIHSPWFQVRQDGRITVPTDNDSSYEGHAVMIVGHRNDEFIIQNSWGKTWGDGGFGYLPYDYVDQYGLGAWRLSGSEGDES